MGNLHRAFAGFDMKYDEVKDPGREAWESKKHKYF